MLFGWKSNNLLPVLRLSSPCASKNITIDTHTYHRFDSWFVSRTFVFNDECISGRLQHIILFDKLSLDKLLALTIVDSSSLIANWT